MEVRRGGACPWGLTPAPSPQSPSNHQDLGGSHSPASTPRPWHPLHRAVTCASVDSPSPVPGQMAWALVPALRTGCVTLGTRLPISGSGTASGIQAQDRRLGWDGRAGDGPLRAPSASQVSGRGRRRGPKSRPRRSCSSDSCFRALWSGELGTQAEPLASHPGQARRLFSEPR